MAARHAGSALTHLRGEEEDWRSIISAYKTLAAGEYKRQIQVWTHGYVVVGDTDAEANDYLRYYAEQRADKRWVEAWVAELGENAPKLRPDQLVHMSRNWAAGGGQSLVGTPETIVDRMAKFSRVGLDGILLTALFTLTVLTGTVVAIYMMFPARHHVLLTEAIEQHGLEQAWDLTTPAPAELRAWAIGLVGKGAPVPEAAPLGARDLEVLGRRAALMRVAVGGEEVTYLVQRARGITPKREERVEGEVLAVAWRSGKFSCVAVGPKATSKAWLAAFAP